MPDKPSQPELLGRTFLSKALFNCLEDCQLKLRALSDCLLAAVVTSSFLWPLGLGHEQSLVALLRLQNCREWQKPAAWLLFAP